MNINHDRITIELHGTAERLWLRKALLVAAAEANEAVKRTSASKAMIQAGLSTDQAHALAAFCHSLTHDL